MVVRVRLGTPNLLKRTSIILFIKIFIIHSIPLNENKIDKAKIKKDFKIRDSVIHLIRGEIFDIDNKKFFTFGGARSHDIADGILNIDEYEKIYKGIKNIKRL